MTINDIFLKFTLLKHILCLLGLYNHFETFRLGYVAPIKNFIN